MIPGKQKTRFIFALAMLASSHVSAAPQPLTFAGIGFIQTGQLAAEAFPHAQRFLTRTEFSEPFYRQIYSVIRGHEVSTEFTLTDSQASMARGTTQSLALAIEAEDLVINRLSAEEYSARYVVDAVIVLFDFSGQNFLSAYPLRVAQTTSFTGYPSERELSTFTARLFNGTNVPEKKSDNQELPQSLIIRKFTEGLERVQIRETYQFSIQVTDIELSQNAEAYLRQNKKAKALFEQRFANTFTTLMAEKIGVPVLPYLKGEVIDRKMALSFEEIGLIGLAMPEPTFEVHLRMRGFGTKLIDRSAHVERYAFITGVGLDIVDAAFEDLLLSRNYQLGIPKNFTKEMFINESYWHMESLASLLSGILDQFVVPDRAWLEAHMPKAPPYQALVGEIETVNQNVFNVLK